MTSAAVVLAASATRQARRTSAARSSAAGEAGEGASREGEADGEGARKGSASERSSGGDAAMARAMAGSPCAARRAAMTAGARGSWAFREGGDDDEVMMAIKAARKGGEVVRASVTMAEVCGESGAESEARAESSARVEGAAAAGVAARRARAAAPTIGDSVGQGGGGVARFVKRVDGREEEVGEEVDVRVERVKSEPRRPRRRVAATAVRPILGGIRVGSVGEVGLKTEERRCGGEGGEGVWGLAKERMCAVVGSNDLRWSCMVLGVRAAMGMCGGDVPSVLPRCLLCGVYKRAVLGKGSVLPWPFHFCFMNQWEMRFVRYSTSIIHCHTMANRGSDFK